MHAHKYYLGKCDYNGSGRRNCKTFITWDLIDGKFSMCAEIWNPRETDLYCSGQCVDEVCKYFPHDQLARRMERVWRDYHLNDMRAGSPAQEALLKSKEPERLKSLAHPVSHYDWASNVLAEAGLNPDPNHLHNGVPYRYGSAWLKRELPMEIIAEIESWDTPYVPDESPIQAPQTA